MESRECAPRNKTGCAVGKHVPLPVWIPVWVSHPRITSSGDDEVTWRSQIAAFLYVGPCSPWQLQLSRLPGHGHVSRGHRELQTPGLL